MANTDPKIFRLKKAIAATDDPTERRLLKTRIGDRAAVLARREYRQKRAALTEGLAAGF